MKKKTAEKLNGLIQILDSIDVENLLDFAVDEAQDKYDNFSERTQESERGELQEELIEHLEAARDAFTEFYSELCEALEIEI